MASKTLASLIVRIGADVTGVTAGLNTLDKRVRATKKQFTTVTDSTLKWQSALGLLAGAAGIGYAAKKVFDLGSSLEETASKFRTVFGASTQDAQKFLDEFANTAGLTITQGRELLATTGAIAQGMGFSGAASEKFAEQITRLSGDLSSFNNIPIAETSRAIQSALTGERESLKRLGIVILETDVQKKALAMTGKENAKALTQQEKATATLALITERAGVAVGDLARTMDSPANRARKIIAEFMDLRDSIAHGLLPAFAVLLEELSGTAGGFDSLSDAIGRSGPIIAAWTRFTVDAFRFVARAIAAPIQIAFNLGEVIGDLARIVGNVLIGDFAGAKQAATELAGQWTDMTGVVTGLVGSFDDMRIASGDAWQAQATVAEQAATTATALNVEAEAARSLSAALSGIQPPTAALGAHQRWLIANMPKVSVAKVTAPTGPSTGGGGMGLGDAGGLLGAAGQVLPGKLGSIASSAGAVASAFASGGPLLGGVALAGAAFKGISSLFGSGKARLQEFLTAVRNAAQSLDDQFGLLDIEDAARQFELTLATAQNVFKGSNFDWFFEGLTPENIQAKVDKLIESIYGANASDERRAFFSGSEEGRAFLEWVKRLEALGDAIGNAGSGLDDFTDAATEATEALRNVPSGYKIALARFRASDPEPGRQVSTGTTGGTGGFTPGFGPRGGGGGDTVWNVDTIVLQGVKDPGDFLTQLEAQVQWRQRTGASVIQTGTR